MRHLTFANVMSSCAVFIALGGAGYAAVKLPANSVGTAQIRDSAVTGAKVKRGSLAASDFAAGQLPRGLQGKQGERGATGGRRGDGGRWGHRVHAIYRSVAGVGRKSTAVGRPVPAAPISDADRIGDADEEHP